MLPQVWLWSWFKASVKKDGYAGWEANLKKSEEGKLIGTQVHERLEHLVMNLPIVEYETRAGEYAKAIYDVVNPTVQDYVAIEPHLVSERLKLHGTADCIVKVKDRQGLFVDDYKTSYQKDIAHPIQLAVYALSWNEHNDEKIDAGRIIRIDKNSKNLNVKIDEYLNLKQYVPVIESLRTIWGYLNKEK